MWGMVRSARIDSLIRRVETARIPDLEEIIPQLDLTDRSVAVRVTRLFGSEDAQAKRNAALVLAPICAEAEDHVVDWFLSLEPRELNGRLPVMRRQVDNRLIDRLEAEAQGDIVAGVTPPEAERRDRRRCSAAAALILLGHDGHAWKVLESSPNPQARSFLIAALGPAGVEPERLIARLNDSRTSDSERSAIIQSLGEIPKPAWPPELHGAMMRRLLEIYRDDPDAGVHGSAKWLLLRWGCEADLDQIDRELATVQRDDPRFRWRISRQGITLVTVEHPRLRQAIEVSDTEITVAMFLRFKPDFDFMPQVSSEATSPINGISFHDAAEFCNWLNEHEGVPPGMACYRRIAGPDRAYEPVPNHRDLAGFRLPADYEFDVFCSAGTTTRRYFGDTDALFERYAWILPGSGGKAHPVARKLPNDLGLFDTLGNLQEWCETASPRVPGSPMGAELRGGWMTWIPPGEVDRFSVVPNVPVMDRPDVTYGFRVVRTRRKL
jgi:hypothetical protein